MAISVELKLDTNERAQLAQILGCGDADLDEKLGPFANAALEEYVRMFLGQRVFTRGSDILEYRLLLLTKEALDGRVPDEQRVCALFQRSATGSRSLIRAVLAKYQYELSAEVAATMKDTLAAVTEDADGWSVNVNSDNVVETMNRMLATIDGSLPQMAKKAGTVCSFVLKPSSYQKLCEHYQVKPEKKRKA